MVINEIARRQPVYDLLILQMRPRHSQRVKPVFLFVAQGIQEGGKLKDGCC